MKNSPQNEIRLLSRKQLGERWQKSIQTLKRWEQEKALLALKIGRDVRYRLSDIERFETEAEVH